MGSENPLIKIDGDITKPATVLIQKVSNAIGVLYEPTRIVKLASAEAEAEKIKAIAKIEISEIEQRGLRRLISEEAKKQDNIEKITAGALTELKPDAKPDQLNDDWLAYFFDRAKLISDREMQILWSRILAEEANKSGTFSKTTINVVNLLSKEEAHLFTALCTFQVHVNSFPVPLIISPRSATYTKRGLDPWVFNHLDNIGLIKFSELAESVLRHADHLILKYFDDTFVSSSNEIFNFPLGYAAFTQVGFELSTICNAQKCAEFSEQIFLEYTKYRPFHLVKT